MRFRCTAKVERHAARSHDSPDIFHVRVACIPMHQEAPGNHLRAVSVVVSTPEIGAEWSSLERGAQHQRIESFVRSYVKKRGVQWVHAWQPDIVERIELAVHPVALCHDDPGDPFEIALV